MKNFIKSFALKLIFSFTFIIFIGFLIIYYAFNMLVENHITTEAERELAGVLDNVSFTIRQSPIGHFISPARGSSFLNTNAIVIFNYSEIFFTSPDNLIEQEGEVVNFLTDYYINNRFYFEQNEMIRLYFEEGAYYFKALNFSFAGNTLSTLVYTDISEMTGFKNDMNRILIFLLASSAFFSFLTAIIMGVRFKMSITELGSYAGLIGRGDFDKKLPPFKDSEFEQLSKSMGNMQDMLKTYEDGQKKFFANVSHELRTPLMVIQGYSEGILENVFEKDVAKIILEETKTMEEMVKSLIYISRMDSGLELPNISEINMGQFCEDCIDNVKIVAEQNNKIITLRAQNETNIEISTDEKKLKTVIINILVNAIRYAEKEIIFSYYKEADFLKIKIKDDGIGIKEEDLPHIFERFYKGDTGQSGLGLAIASDMVKTLGGSLTAKNTEKGAEFTVTLPLFTKNYI
ncbi:MAG: HAMP domain-containing histidine kinase [Defluviitaleaceae bacterium]|nr:HAMP domain-containing histidine kinase [Defluviitaleaceae bacterium]